MKTICFDVPGLPQSQGSLRAFVRGNKAILTSTNTKLRAWRADVRTIAADHCPEPTRGAVTIGLGFDFPRPASHYGTGKNAEILRRNAPVRHMQTPDLDKCLRASLDALSGIVYHDDKQVVQTIALKRWSLAPATSFAITFLDN